MPNRRRAIAIVAAVLVVLAPNAALAAEPPAIPVGVFYTSSKTDAAYVQSVARSLKERGFNAVAANGAFTRETVDIFQSRGIWVIARGDKFLDHPAVIASLIGDEPLPNKGTDLNALKAQYRDLSQKTDKPLIACLAGDGMGLYGPDDPRRVWDELAPKVRCFRWYGISRSHYGVLHKRSSEGYLAFPSVLAIGHQAAATPWWIVLQAFGTDEHEAEYKNPSPAQIRAMTHLALAHGARGILYWALQDQGARKCLVDEDSLKAGDDKYAAAGEMAASVAAHGELLASLKRGGLDIRCPSPVVQAVARQDGSGKRYVYAVNKDTEAAAPCRLLLWADRWTWTKARDVFSGKDLEVKPRDVEGYLSVSLTLAPGEGQLLATDAGDKPSEKTGAGKPAERKPAEKNPDEEKALAPAKE